MNEKNASPIGSKEQKEKVFIKTPQICTWRGIMTKLMTSSYNLNQDWEFLVCRKGVSLRLRL